MKKLTVFKSDLTEYIDNTLRPGVAEAVPPYMVYFMGKADVSKDGLCDIMDVIGNEPFIKGYMLHFVAEFPGTISDSEMILYQRRFITLFKQYIEEKTNIHLTQGGDDLYYQGRKLSVSIVAPSTINTYLMHAAFNINKPEDCPLDIAYLDEFTEISPDKIGREILQIFKNEIDTINFASKKVKPISGEGHLSGVEALFKQKEQKFRTKITRDWVEKIIQIFDGKTSNPTEDDLYILLGFLPDEEKEDYSNAITYALNDPRKLKALWEAMLIRVMYSSQAMKG